VDTAFSHRLVALLPKLRRFAYGLTGSMDEGDDLVQAACERALSRVDQFEPGTQLHSWMYSIIRSVWIDDLRRRKRRGTTVDLADLAEHPGGDAEVEAESRLRLADVWRAVERLPPEQRDVLLLVSVEELAYRDAAEVLGVPIGTVMSRLSRARLALGRALEQDLLEAPRAVDPARVE
jgi:RNA polymerase sigma-70 factor (ECF subfamily)